MTSVNFRDSSHALYIRIHIALLSIQSHWAYFPETSEYETSEYVMSIA